MAGYRPTVAAVVLALLLVSCGASRTVAAGEPPVQFPAGVLREQAKYWRPGDLLDSPPAGVFAKGEQVTILDEQQIGDGRYLRVLWIGPGARISGWVREDQVAVDLGRQARVRVQLGALSLRRLWSPRQNTVVSPEGLHSVLRVLQEGARGETRREIDTLIGGVDGAAGAIQTEGFRSMDCLAVRTDAELTDSFVAFAAQRRLEIRRVRFDEPDRTSLNAWIEDQTASQIPEFFSPDSWKPSLHAIVLNVCHFREEWDAPFAPHATRSRPFFRDRHDRVEVDMMHKAGHLALFGDDALECDGAILPYHQSDIAAIVIVPRAIEGLGRLLERLDADTFGRLFADMPPLARLPRGNGELFLPKFDLQGSVAFEQSLPLKTLQSPEADLSGMFRDRGLFVEKIPQRTRLRVDETGTEASAVTAAEIAKGAEEEATVSKVVTADRPFAFLIVHWPTRTPLFIAAVGDPRSREAEPAAAEP